MKKHDHIVYFSERRKDGSRLAFYFCGKEKCVHFGEKVCFLCDTALKSAIGSLVFDKFDKEVRQ